MPPLPYLVPIAVHQEGPVVLDEERAAVGHFDVTYNLRVIQDAAKIQIHSLEVEVWEVHFTPKGDLVLMRVFQIPDSQDLLCNPGVQILSVGRVKPDGEMLLLSSLQCLGLY